MPRHWIKVVVWLALSAGFFAGAASLTEMITTVNGQPVYAKHRRLPLEPLGTIQNVSIFTRAASREITDKIHVSFKSDHDGSNPLLKIDFPTGIDAKIIVNNLASGKCTSEYGDSRSITTVAYGDFYLVTRRGYYPFAVVCPLASIVSAHTFTKERAKFEFVTPGDPFLFTDVELAAAIDGFSPLPNEIISFDGVDGADEFRFDGGYQNQTLRGFESTRALEPNGIFTVTWSDVDAEQLRDLLLVVVGTLIGIAVTMLIEALRILIDAPRMFAGVPRMFAGISKSLASRRARSVQLEGT